jgi:hypothetical protein
MLPYGPLFASGHFAFSSGGVKRSCVACHFALSKLKLKWKMQVGEVAPVIRNKTQLYRSD